MAIQDNGEICIFGGFVKGSRNNELASYTKSGSGISCDMVNGGGESGPIVRAGHSMAINGANFYVFGGQDDDNNKLNDVWCYNGAAWTNVTY